MRTAALALLAVVALAIALLAFVLTTPPGARVTLQLLAPEGLAVERVDGRLWGDLQMEGVRYAHERAEVEIRALRLRWTPSALFQRALVLDDLRADGVTVRLRTPPTEEPEAEEPLPELELPVRVQLDSARATEVVIHLPPPEAGEEPLLAEPLRLAGLVLRADVGRQGSVAFSAELWAPAAQPGWAAEARVAGELLARGDYPMELRLDWQARPADEPALAGSGEVSGDLNRLALSHMLREPVPARLQGEVRDALAELWWQAELDVPRFRLAAVRREWPAHAAEARLEAAGGRDWASGSGSARLFPEEGGQVTAFIEGRYAEERLRLDSLVLGAPPMDGRLSAAGEISLAAERPRFRLAGRWSDLAWPPVRDEAAALPRAGEGAVASPDARAAAGASPGPREAAARPPGPEVQSPAGEFRLEGTTARYTLEARALVEGPEIPSGEWRLAGVGDSEALTISELRGRTLEGEVRASGRVAWSPMPAWRLELDAEDLRPEIWAPRWPGEVALSLRTEGESRNGLTHATVELVELSGTLRNEPVAGALRLRVAGERLEADTVWARYGDATVQAAGTVGARWDLRWALHVPELSLLAVDTLRPDLTGALQAEGRVVGSREAPEIGFALRAEELATPALRVERVDGRADVDLSGATPSRIELAATRLLSDRGPEGGLALDGVRLTGEGVPEAHQLAVEGGRAEDRFRVALAGGLAERGAGPGGEGPAWDGRVETLVLETPTMTWRLREPAPLRAGMDAARVQGLCWEQVDDPGAASAESARACLSGQWTRVAGGSGELAAIAIPLELLAPFMPPEFEAAGELTLRARGEVDAAGEARGTAALRAGPGRLFYVPVPGRRMERPYEVIALDIEAVENVLEARLELAMADGVAEGRVRAPLEGDGAARPLEGELTARFADRGLLGALSLDLEETAGLLTADLAFGGTTAEPAMVGTLRLQEAAASVLPLGIRLHDVELEAGSAAADRWRIEGSLRSGEGTLSVEGGVRLAAAEEPWELDVTFRGERFEAYNTADAWLLANPDLRAQGSPDGILFTGTVLLPSGRITPEDLQILALQPSPDVVLVGPGTEGPELVEEPPLPMPIRAEVVLTAGDSLLLNAMGVEGRLEGSVAVSYAPDRPTLARGELDVLEGTYTAYHQELEIERGRILYPDIPLTNPGLDIRVVREPRPDIRVGMDVRGTAREPEATLFSEPTMPEAEALSWFILGRSMLGADQEDGELLADAARSAGFAGGELLAGRLAAAFGLEEARVERDPEGGAFILGARLAPNLYVAYTIGLFEAADVLNIRYEFGRWTLTTQTGFETAADILYRAGGEELPAPELVPPTLGGEGVGPGRSPRP